MKKGNETIEFVLRIHIQNQILGRTNSSGCCGGNPSLCKNVNENIKLTDSHSKPSTGRSQQQLDVDNENQVLIIKADEDIYSGCRIHIQSQVLQIANSKW